MVALILDPVSVDFSADIVFSLYPRVYINLDEGLRSVSGKMLEMARLFRLSGGRRIRAVYLPAVMPYLLSACRVSVGMALKAGVAGEIIGLPRWSIGEQLYLSKLYLNTADLFAWSLVIIVSAWRWKSCSSALRRPCSGNGGRQDDHFSGRL